MKYRRLGRTGLAVSPICLGTMGYGPPTEQADVDHMVRLALDHGINFIDTANCYDGPNRGEIVLGTSESMLGKALEGLRDDVVLLTKAAVPLRPGPQHRGLSSTHLQREIDNSLRRLRTDYVDIFMIHWPDPFADTEEVLRAIDRIVGSGKARYFGISNHQGWEVCEYLWKADRRGWPMAGVSEVPLSILDRRYENDLPFYEKNQIGVIPYQPLKAGILSGRYRRVGMAGNEDRAIAGWEPEMNDAVLDQVEALMELAEGYGVTLAQFALAWDLAQPAVSSVIVGARADRDLISALEADRIARELTADTLAAVDRIAPGPVRPAPRFER